MAAATCALVQWGVTHSTFACLAFVPARNRRTAHRAGWHSSRRALGPAVEALLANRVAAWVKDEATRLHEAHWALRQCGHCVRELIDRRRDRSKVLIEPNDLLLPACS
eukprot:CAMPEP_0115873034 /NCGR_PEP_ID=MMETSP0287-20121206/23763_1 /TAXON_ID=412157 /ORGANISM="Chrysochromulina rotalis, Strain UIO044" /LENGTH=107 /DNA_ID=CAMNT_0003328033 /DNA_START=120 /DNA_END=443 /DNA_ORIENTATION=+